MTFAFMHCRFQLRSDFGARQVAARNSYLLLRSFAEVERFVSESDAALALGGDGPLNTASLLTEKLRRSS
jgi:hypothetical protein